MIGFIYAIANSSGHAKIGYSCDPLRRLTKIQSDNSEACTLIGVTPGALADEAELHDRFADLRIRGEWFLLCGPLKEFADQLRSLSSDRASSGLQPASGIIAKCGGPQAVAEMLGVDLTTVHKWKYPRAKGGTDGRIPTSRQHELLKRAQKAGIKLSPEDFFASADTPADLHAEAAQ